MPPANLPQTVGTARHQQYARTLCHETGRGGLADIAAATGDQGSFSRELCHCRDSFQGSLGFTVPGERLPDGRIVAR